MARRSPMSKMEFCPILNCRPSCICKTTIPVSPFMMESMSSSNISGAAISQDSSRPRRILTSPSTETILLSVLPWPANPNRKIRHMNLKCFITVSFKIQINDPDPSIDLSVSDFGFLQILQGSRLPGLLKPFMNERGLNRNPARVSS